MLGGSDLQVSIIKLAKQLGHIVYTCDYLPDNPGHKYSDKYFNISTTDKEDVLELARMLDIDGILSYASDPSSTTAAYVSEQLNLPGNNLNSVLTLAHKNLFREFQKSNNLPHPKFKYFTKDEFNQASDFLKKYKNNFFLIKPVDASGSKGVYEIKEATFNEDVFKKSISFSKQKTVIIEEFISKKGLQIGGDGFIVDGKLLFRCFGDIHFSKTNKFLPCSVSVPTIHSQFTIEKVHNEIQKIITLCGMKTGGLNFDVIINENDEVIVLEIGPRNGGNLLPELIHYCTGVDMRIFAIKACLGEDCSDLKMKTENKYFAHYVIHGLSDGRFDKITISNYLEPFILYKNVNINKGDYIYKFENSSNRLGMLLLKFNTKSQMEDIIYNMHDYLVFNYE